MKALTFSQFGNPEVLEYLDIPVPEIKENDVLVKMKAVGLNYADIYRRKGNYHLKGKPPYIAGYEGSGIISQSNSNQYKPGERVAFTDVPFANAEYVVVPEDQLIPIPEVIDFNLASSVLLQGLTAHYLSSDSYNVKVGDVVLIHAASGGVGQILTQICKNKGAIVIGLTRNSNKLQTLKDCRADFPLLLNETWKSNVLKITENKGVDVVFDSIGSTLEDSFDLTKERGTVVFYGMSGGDPKFIDPRMLMDSSKTLTGGDLWNYLTSASERKTRANFLFDQIISAKIKIKDPVKFKLSEGRNAHKFLESGKSSSKILLIPDSEF